MGYWPYDRMFAKYKADCSYFFETGTHLGDSVNDALNLNFDKIYSIEFDPNFYNHCIEKFKDVLNDKVFLYLGDSSILIKNILPTIDKKTMFWLDAHGNGGGNPFSSELESIMNHHIKNHVIIVDDIGNYGCDESFIIKTISSYNPDYKFVEDNCTPTSKQLIAYI